MKRIRLWFLKRELRRSRFTIGGYEDCMVRLNNRWLKEWAVKEVHKLRAKGIIKSVGIQVITSPHGCSYEYTLYTLKDSKP